MKNDKSLTIDLVIVSIISLGCVLSSIIIDNYKYPMGDDVYNLVMASLGTLTFGYIHSRYNNVMTYLYRMNPISRTVDNRFVKIIGIVCLLISAICIITLIVKLTGSKRVAENSGHTTSNYSSESSKLD